MNFRDRQFLGGLFLDSEKTPVCGERRHRLFSGETQGAKVRASAAGARKGLTSPLPTRCLMPVAGKNDVTANPRFSSLSDFSARLAHNVGSSVAPDSEILTAHAGKTRVQALN